MERSERPFPEARYRRLFETARDGILILVVRLPLARASDRPRRAALAPSRSPSRRLKVLVVDDNHDLVEMLELAIDGMGHEVRRATDGETAISAALAYRPDVVLLDIGLPIISGLEVARQLRQCPELSHTRLIALTGWGDAADRRQTAEVGFDHHLIKPADPAELETLLARLSAPSHCVALTPTQEHPMGARSHTD
jgi:CheY-like chemotaxis protein